MGLRQETALGLCVPRSSLTHRPGGSPGSDNPSLAEGPASSSDRAQAWMCPNPMGGGLVLTPASRQETGISSLQPLPHSSVCRCHTLSPHFTEEETEAQRLGVTYSKPHRWWVAKRGEIWTLTCLTPKSVALTPPTSLSCDPLNSSVPQFSHV